MLLVRALLYIWVTVCSKGLVMLLKYGGHNFYCFKDEFEVDLRLNKNCPKGISQGKDYSNVMCIKGANAAGKTNALKAFSFLCNFVTNSFNNKPDKKIVVESYFSNTLPISLFSEFRINSEEYRYELTTTKTEVISEKLINLGKVSSILFSREGDDIIELDEDFEKLRSIPQIRSNASLISVANQHEIDCISDVHDFFYNSISNVKNNGFKDLLEDDVHRFYHDIPKALTFARDLLVKFDTGISDILIDTYTNSEDEEIFYPVFIFDIEGDKKSLRLQHQSSGTRRLYYLLGYCFLVINYAENLPYSRVFIADELDLHLHSKILPEITKLFEESENTQLIFTCQNDQILDDMGKYRTVLINKEENESYIYRLDELPSDLLRNGRPISPHYASGNIGGVPEIG